MRKTAVLLVLLLLVVAFAGSVFAAEYDRYERGYAIEAPPTSSQPRAAQVPPKTHMNYGPGYIGVQVGFYEPNDDWFGGLATYDTGVSLNMVFGSRLTTFFALEGSIGYFESRSNVYKGRLSVVPVTIGGRLIVPNPVIEPYVGAGLGMYFASLKEDYGVKDDKVDIGGYMSLGVDFWLHPRVALNVEGRYQWIESRFEGYNVDLSGWNTFLGARVLF